MAFDWGNVGKIFEAVGPAISYFAGDKAADAAKDQASDQADEVERAAQANAEISYRDAETARRIGMNAMFEKNAEAGLMYKQMQKLLSTQLTRFAKSGVAPSSGSPVTVMERTTIDIGRDIQNIKYQGQTAKARGADLEARYKLLAKAGLRDAAATASMIEEAGDDRATAIMWNTWSNTAKQIHTVGEEYNWF